MTCFDFFKKKNNKKKKLPNQAFALIGGAMIFGFTLYFARVKSLMFIPKARAM